MATENPIEQEGTYTLPEAQVDRFMLKVVITYPSAPTNDGFWMTGPRQRIYPPPLRW